MKNILTAATALLWATAAVAGPNWSYVELGYTVGDNDAGNTAPNNTFPGKYEDGTKAWNLNGLIELGNVWHLGALYEKGEFNTSTDTKAYGAIAGIHPAVTDNTDLLVQVTYTRAESRPNDCGDFYDEGFYAAAVIPCGSKFKNNFWSIETGLRSMLTPAVEVNAVVIGNKNRWNDIEVAAKLGGQYLFTKNVGITTFAKVGESETTANIGIRYNFGDANLNQIELNGTR